MAAINPYLLFNGNCEEAFDFYRSIFGGEYPMVMRFKDAPPEHQGSEGEGNKIMHIALPIGKGNVLMASDAPEAQKVTIGSNFNISITASSKEEADKFFNQLSAGGQVYMPMSNTFWGSYFGMLKDRFDVQWMVSYDSNFQQ
jgi:PhnB protein